MHLVEISVLIDFIYILLIIIIIFGFYELNESSVNHVSWPSFECALPCHDDYALDVPRQQIKPSSV